MTDSGTPNPQFSRRRFIRTGSTGIALGGLAGSLLAGERPAAASVIPDVRRDLRELRDTGQEALRLLMAGNARWVRGRPKHPNQSIARRKDVAPHQDPFAVVISCIDSRVPPELVFDRGLGDLFSIRAGAQALDEQVVLGSIEFGPVNYPSVRLVFVLGHQRCGAVSAAIKVIKDGGTAPGHIQAVVDALKPAYDVAVKEQGDLVDNMVRAQTRLTVSRLKAHDELKKLITSNGLVIVGGEYLLDSGKVKIIT
jgi:carbonic anhydrase